MKLINPEQVVAYLMESDRLLVRIGGAYVTVQAYVSADYETVILTDDPEDGEIYLAESQAEEIARLEAERQYADYSSQVDRSLALLDEAEGAVCPREGTGNAQ